MLDEMISRQKKIEKLLKQWKKHPKLVPLVEKISIAIETDDKEAQMKFSGDFGKKAQELGMPLSVAKCCGIEIVDGKGNICEECRNNLEDV